MSETINLQAVISVKDSGYTKAMQNAEKASEQLRNTTELTTSSISKASAVGSLAASAIQKAFSAITSSIGSAVSRLDTMNNFPKVMQSLGYTSDEATASINKLSDGINGLPTTLDGIVSSAQTLTASLGDLEKGTSSAIALNDMFLSGGQRTGCRNSYWSNAGHFIAVVGYSNGKYNVYDPAYAARDGYHDWSDFQGNIKHVYTTNIKWASGTQGSSQSDSNDYCYKFTCDQIGSGAQGKTVKLLQTLLKGRGWNLDIDGSFGKATYDVVIAVQKFFKLTADGIVGIKTWRALIASDSETSGVNVTFKLHSMKAGYQGADAYFLQNILKGLGYYTGNLDTSFGNGCLGAVKAFQKTTGMAGDGEVGANTYRNLIGF